jgi:hypothetical protein
MIEFIQKTIKRNRNKRLCEDIILRHQLRYTYISANHLKIRINLQPTQTNKEKMKDLAELYKGKVFSGQTFDQLIITVRESLVEIRMPNQKILDV